MAIETHKVEVVPIKLEKHPNADKLSLVKVFDGYTVVVRTEDWEGIETGAYIPPDNVVPDTPQFDFLRPKGWEGPMTEKHRRIKVRQFRGVLSEGMLIPTPDGFKIGDDVAEHVGITHYEPSEDPQNGGPSQLKGGYTSALPDVNKAESTYDIEAWQKYRNAFVYGEPVIVTEKIHGANARFTYAYPKKTKFYWKIFGVKIPKAWPFRPKRQMHAGSRKRWIKPDEKCIWWEAVRQNPWIEKFCKQNPDSILYGEVFGNVQSLKYGTKTGEPNENKVMFRAFDVFHCNHWLNPFVMFNAIHKATGIDLAVLMQTGRDSGVTVPIVYRGMYVADKIQELASGKSLIEGADHIREGIVIKPIIDRHENRVGRVIMKIVSSEYLQGDWD